MEKPRFITLAWGSPPTADDHRNATFVVYDTAAKRVVSGFLRQGRARLLAERLAAHPEWATVYAGQG